MSKLTISNLDAGRELDTAERRDVAGGMQLPGLGHLPMYGMTNVVASINSATVAQNPVNIVMGGSAGAGDTVNYIGSANVTPVNIGSPVTVVQGGLPV